MRRSGLDLEEDFRRLFAEHHRHVLAYALRRCDQRADAEDVVAGTVVVAGDYSPARLQEVARSIIDRSRS